MTEEAQRIAIAEVCGWEFKHRAWWKGDTRMSEMPIPKTDVSGWLPDYLNDLNAMHSALASQSPQFRAEFQEHLDNVAITRKCLVCDLNAEDWAFTFLATLTRMAETKRHDKD